MAIFIFEFLSHEARRKSRSGRRSLACLAALILGASGSAAGSGYVISAKDRAAADALTQQAYAAYQGGDYAGALGCLEQAERLKPDQPDGWNLRGMVLLKQRAFDKAQAAFGRAMALDPHLWAAQFNLAEVFYQQKDYAHARARFEKLLAQTDRFKDGKHWELVQYKIFLSCLLMGDEASATKKLAKLPASGGPTPAYFYAQAALSFSRKDPAGARKSLASAQAAFPPEVNALFLESLVLAGWQSAPPPPALASAAGTYNPPPAPASALGASGGSRAPFVIDPRLEAAAADPLPVPDTGAHPILTQMTPTRRSALPPLLPSLNPTPAPSPTPSLAAAKPPARPAPPAPTPLPEVALEHGGLLLE